MIENIALAFQGIWNHKLRSFLTMLGIIIGIASIITIVSTIKGTNDQIKANLIGAGTDVVKVQLTQDNNPVDFSYTSLPSDVGVITAEQLEQMRKLDKVQNISLYYSRNYTSNVFYQNTAFSGNLYGIDEQYFSVNNFRLVCGRNFVADDFQKFRKVAIVDSRAVNTLFHGSDPIGKTLELSGEPFTIVGVMEQNSSFTPTIENFSDYLMYADTSSGTVFIPSSTWPIVYQYDEPYAVAVRAASTDDMTEAGNHVASYLNDNVVSGSTYAYQSEDLLQQAKNLQDLSSAANRQLIWIAGISLLVGGIGVMNIMLVSVTERTREIGLKKAIGAKCSRIRLQFLTEAAVLTCLGGLLGVIAGIILAKMMSKIMSTPTAISIPASVIAVVFSMLIGIVFGLIPAIKASKLNPIDALRSE